MAPCAPLQAVFNTGCYENLADLDNANASTLRSPELVHFDRFAAEYVADGAIYKTYIGHGIVRAAYAGLNASTAASLPEPVLTPATAASDGIWGWQWVCTWSL